MDVARVVKRRDRNRSDTGLAGDAPAQRKIVTGIRQLVGGCHRKIGGGDIANDKSRLSQSINQQIAAARHIAAQAVEITVWQVQSECHCGLQRGRRREGDELMRLGDRLQQFSVGGKIADLPSRHRKGLSGRADPHHTVAHFRKRQQRFVATTVIDQMLIDLVADRHEIIFQQQRSDPGQLLTRKQLADRIHRRVQHDRAGARRDCCFQSVERQLPVWRIKPHLHRRGTRPADDGRIAVVSGLEQDDLIARLQQRQKAISERLRGARGHQHLALPIDVEPKPTFGIAGHRLAQRRQSHHGRILMGSLAQRADCGFNQLGRFKANFRKALSKIDGLHFGRKPRHRFKDRGRCHAKYGIRHCMILSIYPTADNWSVVAVFKC